MENLKTISEQSRRKTKQIMRKYGFVLKNLNY